MKIYLASSWKNAARVLEVKKILVEAGHEVDAFCDTSQLAEDRFVFNYDNGIDAKDVARMDAIDFLEDPRTQRAFAEDKKWLDWADCVVLILPAGNSSHLEAGYAKGKEKYLIILGGFPPGEVDVMYGFADVLVRNEDQLKLCLYWFANNTMSNRELFENQDKLNEYLDNMGL